MTRLLIVDDEVQNLKAIQRVFGETTHEIATAESGAQALESVAAHPPALVILDIMMPGMNGLEACEKIKQISPDTMVLLLSARSELPDRMKGYSALADDYLAKPYDPGELLARSRILLRLHTTQQELSDLNHHLEATIQNRTTALIHRERQATAAKMIQGIVHNLKGPLSGASLSAQLLEREVKNLTDHPGGSRVETHTRTILSALGKAFDLVESLLSVGGSNPKEKAVSLDINLLIQQEYRLLRPDLVLTHQVEVFLDLAEKLPLIQGKPSDFSQVFYNLMKNACDAMVGAPQKQLRIATRCTEDELIVDFADTGRGIDPNQVDAIFDPFYSTKAGQDPSSSGSGLGLFISSQLIAPYQGKIQVGKKAGKGTVFHVHIPLNPEEAP
ncbi:MAG: response regulator [Desulfobacterales bacterium]|nr:response regulator [Desulfobacterales bacterium]